MRVIRRFLGNTTGTMATNTFLAMPVAVTITLVSVGAAEEVMQSQTFSILAQLSTFSDSLSQNP